MKSVIFRGVGTALITPHREGKIDYPALEMLIERQIGAGIEAIIIGGTTGEAATLDEDERYELFSESKKIVGGRCKLIFGTGANDTKLALRRTAQAEEIGCDGVLIVTPYYNKGTRKGIIMHYEELAKSVDLPIILYNVPKRTGVDLTPDMINEISELDNVVAIKEASGSRARLSEISKKCNVRLYAGNDADTSAVLSLGGLGVISVVSNLYPQTMHKLTEAWHRGERDEAIAIEKALTPMIDALFLDTNPAPVKYALSRLGLCTTEMRLPMHEIDTPLKASIDTLMMAYGEK